ncbi:hypothetical protein FRC20_008871 [Serendipita sp. 405]|nr:hypothetical protein FRC20_008871 [Serendipita sp. 405]
MQCLRRLNLRIRTATFSEQLVKSSTSANLRFYVTYSSTKSAKDRKPTEKKDANTSKLSRKSKEVKSQDKVPKKTSTKKAVTKANKPEDAKETTVRKAKTKSNKQKESELPTITSDALPIPPLEEVEQDRPKSTVRVGTEFELRSLKLLRENLSMDLSRVAGPGDGGVDLIGWWWLPRLPHLPSDDSGGTSKVTRIRVLAQCKAEKSKLGPHYVREMEGVMYRLLHTHKMPSTGIEEADPSPLEREVANSLQPMPTVAMLASLSPFTNKAVLRAMSSPIPFILLHLPPQDTAREETSKSRADNKQLLPSLQWNPALASEQGLLKGQMDIRWQHTAEGGFPVIWWGGQPLSNHVPSP